jgi:hypothetical protein
VSSRMILMLVLFHISLPPAHVQYLTIDPHLTSTCICTMSYNRSTSHYNMNMYSTISYNRSMSQCHLDTVHMYVRYIAIGPHLPTFWMCTMSYNRASFHYPLNIYSVLQQIHISFPLHYVQFLTLDKNLTSTRICSTVSYYRSAFHFKLDK